MTASYKGSCNCGAVTATFEGEPAWARQCWCRQCQKAAAGGATNNALFSIEGMVLNGEVSWSGYTADSGNTVEQGFCPQCGTPIFGRNSARKGSWVVRLGFLDGDHGIRPTTAIWLDEAPEWAVIDPELEQFRRQTPPPPAS
ncbi:GFA family protein [Novosphingobium mangrovi (ex Huang et al. 2023)]|uniref:GFA family protein n=1 Tax=Novosphingobium mangrovi (ex Huang et al. 2023) TaxID=2976432 RepID=A0ABT2I7I6_9SPHN|nr:GFA family protein [Novosphingobium mangrovi (ex Huang et al. 2023)]MCT2400779.1 GFA family protein [Novosphingobium mangrovi (ex Huang et al. 2023)]